MRLPIRWVFLVLVVLLGGRVLAHPGLTVQAAPASQESCPEPNNDFQRACFIAANAQGVLDSPDDVDAYRFEALDHGTQVQVALLDPPAPYRLNLADWTGVVIASSSLQEGSEVIDARVGPPGSYYVFVDSKSGEVSPEPYRLLYQPTYAGPAPRPLFSREFGAGTEDNAYPSTAEADFLGGGGKVTIVMKVGGTPERPREANVTLGPAVADFTLAVDSRLVNAETSVDAIYAIGFRATDDSAYRLLIDVHKSAARLQFVRGDTVTDLSDWVVSGAIDTRGGVNRTVIRAVGPSIQVNMNGQPLLEAAGPSAQAGRFQLGLITESEPPIVSFDNMLVTTRPVTPSADDLASASGWDRGVQATEQLL